MQNTNTHTSVSACLSDLLYVTEINHVWLNNNTIEVDYRGKFIKQTQHIQPEYSKLCTMHTLYVCCVLRACVCVCDIEIHKIKTKYQANYQSKKVNINDCNGWFGRN